jgi:VanZ family protein
MTIRSGPMTLALRWGPALAWMALIFAASSLSSEALESAGSAKASRSAPVVANQVTAHLIEFGVLAALLYRALSFRRGLFVQWVVVVVVTTVYGASDEFHQSFVPGRYPSWLDIGFDTVGAILGSSAALAWIWLRRRVRPSIQ